jgi:hypothetical protein
MYEREAKLYELMRRLCQRISADIDEGQLTHQPAPGIKPPLWVLGHLAICTDYAAGLLGMESVCPKTWHVCFGPGSQNVIPERVQPTKGELLAAIDRGHERVTAALKNVADDAALQAALEQPHGMAMFDDSPLVTRADLLAHVLTTHLGFHLGQLSTWRRQMGFDPLF